MLNKEFAEMYREHLGKIFFNISIASLVLTWLIGVAPMVLVFIVWFFMLIIGMVSLFTLFFNEDFMNTFNSLTDILNNVGIETITPIITGLDAVAIVSSILSILIFATTKCSGRKGRIIGSIVVLLIAIIALIVIYCLGGDAE